MAVAFIKKITSLSEKKSNIFVFLKKIQPFVIVILMIAVILQLIFHEKKIVYKDNPIQKVISSTMTTRVVDDTMMTKEISNVLKKIRQDSVPLAQQFSAIDTILLQSYSAEEFIYLTLKLVREFGSNAKQLQQSDIDSIIEKTILEEKNKLASAQSAIALKYDSNGDKIVTKAELKEQSKVKSSSAIVQSIRNQNIKEVLELDKNADGIISYEEMTDVVFSRADITNSDIFNAEALLKLDLNHDAILTAVEARKVARALFAFVDKDHDELLSQEEKDAFKKYLQTEVFDQFKVKKEQELHAVSVVKGYLNNENGNGTPMANVTIDRPEKEVVLLLSSTNPLQWNITSADRTNIVKIMVNSGNKDLTTVYLNKKQYNHIIDWGSGVMPYESYGIEFVKFKEQIKQKTGVETLASFSGAYESKDEFVIDVVSSNPNLSVNNLSVNHAQTDSKLPLLLKINGVRAQYNPNAELLNNIPIILEESHVIYSDLQNIYLHVSDQGFKTYNHEGRLLTKVDLDPALPAFTGNKSIAYDENNNIVSIITSGKNSHLYSYDLVQKKWRVFDVQDENYSDIAYNKYKKNYQTIAIDKEGIVSIASFDDAGSQVRIQNFDIRLFSGLSDLYDPSKSSPTLKIFPGKDYLIIAAGKDLEKGQGNIERIYIYNESIDQVNLVWFQEKQ